MMFLSRPTRPRKAAIRRRWLAVAAGAALIGGAAVLMRHGQTEARLLLADPDAIAADAPLSRFATERGRPVYERRCASCHGAAGGGDPGRGVPNLSDADWLYGSGTVGEIERIVTYGIRSHHPKAWNLAVMPAFARAAPSKAGPAIPLLTPEGESDVTAFLIAAAGKPADPEAARRGAALYGGAGGCYDCHGPDGRGDSAIGAPDLVDSTWLYGDGSRDSILNSIAYGRAGMCPAWVGRIGPGDIRAVAVYVHSLSHAASAAPVGS